MLSSNYSIIMSILSPDMRRHAHAPESSVSIVSHTADKKHVSQHDSQLDPQTQQLMCFVSQAVREKSPLDNRKIRGSACL